MNAADYTCRYCRLPSDATQTACINCGAPVDVTAAVSTSGWVEQPPIKDMTRLQFGQSKVQIEGKQVPAADFDLRADDGIWFSHHSLLWADTNVKLGARRMPGNWSRHRAGIPMYMVDASGPGHVAVSGDATGELIALRLAPGSKMWAREHTLVAATGNVGYEWLDNQIYYSMEHKDETKTTYPLGQYGDVFSSAGGAPGLVLLHAPGNVFIRDLADGETVLIQPSALVYRDGAVGCHLHLEYPQRQNLWWQQSFEHRTVWLKLTGPGRIAIQSACVPAEDGEPITSASYHTSYSWTPGWKVPLGGGRSFDIGGMATDRIKDGLKSGIKRGIFGGGSGGFLGGFFGDD